MPENDGTGHCRKDWRRSSATGLASTSSWTTSDGKAVPPQHQRLLSNFSTMSSYQGRGQLENTSKVPGTHIVELGRAGETPRWQYTPTHSDLFQRQTERQETGRVRLHRRPAWQLSDHEKRSLRDQILQERGQRTISYWDLAGEMLKGAGERLNSYYADRRQTFPGCGGKIPGQFDAEYEEDHGVCIVGSKRKTTEDSSTMGGAPLLKRRHLSASADSGVDQFEYTETSRIQAAPTGYSSPTSSQQDFYGYHAIPDVEYPVHAHSGGLLQRLGGGCVRSCGIRRVACGPAQYAVHEPVPGWPTDEYSYEGGTELQVTEPPGPHPYQLFATREFSEEERDRDDDIPLEGNLDNSQTPFMSDDDDDHPGIVNDPESDIEFDQYESDYFNYFNYLRNDWFWL